MLLLAAVSKPSQMAAVTSYTHLQKLDPETNTFLTFTAVRAVGLAVEVGRKEAKTKGLGNVTADSLSEVRVTGQLRFKGEGRGAAGFSARLRPTLRKKNLELPPNPICQSLGNAGVRLLV